MSKNIDIDNEEEILKECDFDYFYNSENCSRELCAFYNDICRNGNNENFDKIQALIDLGRIGIVLNNQNQQIAELKKQLEEKEKEVETLKAKLETAEYWNKKYDDCQQQLALTEKALKLAREYMFNVMCADDVPFESWFIECAKNDWKPS